MLDMATHDDTEPAPGDLEVLQRFLNLHEHLPDDSSVPPSAEMLRTFLVQRDLLGEEQRFTERDRETGLELRDALRALILANAGEAVADKHIKTLERVAEDAELHPHFRYGDPMLVPSDEGVAGAFGQIVAIAFLARFEHTWEHLKLCADEDCRAVFYDRSKNHSGRWCSMADCGNRAKVRAFRERQKAAR
jgi:predicted RNA-binding Zn ribbon-like protein